MYEFKHPRAAEIFDRLREGQSQRCIAKEMHIGERVVRTARKSIDMAPKQRVYTTITTITDYRPAS